VIVNQWDKTDKFLCGKFRGKIFLAHGTKAYGGVEVLIHLCTISRCVIGAPASLHDDGSVLST